MRWKLVLGIAAAVIIALVLAVVLIIGTYDFNNLKPKIRDAVMTATGRQMKINGDIGLKFSLTPTLFAEKVSFQNAPWGSRPDLATMRQLEVKVALIPLIRGFVQVKRLILIEPDLLIETDRSGKSNLEFDVSKRIDAPKEKGAPPSKKPAGMPGLAIDELRIENGTAGFRDGRSGKVYALRIDEFAASLPDPESPIKLKLKASYNGVPFEVSGLLGSLKGFISSERDWPVNLTVDAVDAQVRVNGTLRDPQAFRGIEIGLSAKGKDIANLGKLAGKPIPLQGPFEISGRFSDPSPKTIKAAGLKVAYGGSDLGGTLEVNLSALRPRISGWLSSEKLDLKPFWPSSSKAPDQGKQAQTPASPKRAEEKQEKLFPDTPIKLDPLKEADAAIQYRASNVLLPQLSLKNLSLDVVLKDGMLKLKPFTANIRGGIITSNLELHPQGQNALLNLTMKAEELDIGNLLKDLNITDALKGNANIDADLKSSGNSVAGLMAGLNGTVVFVMGKGEIQNKYLDLLGADLRFNLARLLSSIGQEADRTEIGCLVAGFSVTNGVADTTAFVIDTNYMTILGDGTLNLKTEGLNVGLKPTPKEGMATRLTDKYGITLSDLATPFRLGGTLSHPSLTIDPTETLITLSQRFIGKGLPGSTPGIGTPSGDISKDKNLCTAAVDAAKRGIKFAEAQKPEKKTAVPETPKDIRKQIKEFRKELKRFLRDR